jgi:hypothetical protein
MISATQMAVIGGLSENSTAFNIKIYSIHNRDDIGIFLLEMRLH